MPIDPETYGRYLQTEDRARSTGMSLPEALDRNFLLLTPKRRHDIQVQAVEEVVRRFQRQSPNKLMSYFYQRTEGTAAEMFEAVQQWFVLVANNQADKTLEDL